METNTYSDRPDAAGPESGKRKMADIARQELANLKADLNELVSRVSNLSRSDFEAARDKVMASLGATRESAKDTAKEYADSAKMASRDYADSARQSLGSGLERSCDFIRERPLQSLALAAGVGLLIGALMTRR